MAEVGLSLQNDLGILRIVLTTATWLPQGRGINSKTSWSLTREHHLKQLKSKIHLRRHQNLHAVNRPRSHGLKQTPAFKKLSLVLLETFSEIWYFDHSCSIKRLWETASQLNNSPAPEIELAHSLITAAGIWAEMVIDSRLLCDVSHLFGEEPAELAC